MNSINSNKDLISKLDPFANSADKSIDVNTSSNEFMKNFSVALDELSDLENASQLSNNAIENAKMVIKNWQEPTDNQVDLIFSKMTNEFLA